MSAFPAPASRRIRVEALARLRSPGAALLWQADQLAAPALPSCSSGFPELDAELPGGGWPAAGLIELLLAEPGSGEIRLLAPALGRLGATERELIWIAPPYAPYAPALQALGLPLERLIWLRPADAADGAWAAEQVLRGGCAAAVLLWSDGATQASLAGLARRSRLDAGDQGPWRRLHLAALEGATPLFALRPLRCRDRSSPAALRIGLEPAAGGCLRVDLFKRRGPRLAQPLLLRLPHPAGKLRLPPAAPAGVSAPCPDAVVCAAPSVAAA